MEEFKKIDWLPSIEDIVDNKFLNEERLQAEGAMYQIMNGVFQDPFQDIRPYVPSQSKEEATEASKKTVAKTIANNNKKKVIPKKRTKKKKNKKPQNKPTVSAN